MVPPPPASQVKRIVSWSPTRAADRQLIVSDGGRSA